MDEVEVTQEDINLVANFYTQIDWLENADCIVNGLWSSDDKQLLEDAARHRIAAIAAARATEYICKCGLRVEPHHCRDTKGEF